MGLLNRFFRSSPATIAAEIVEDDTKMIELWKAYFDSTKEKGELIDALQSGPDLQSSLQRLKEIVALELVKISAEEKTEEELLADVNAIEHDKNIEHVHRLEACLAYAETKYKYVYHLLEELLKLLERELHLVEKLSKSSKNEATFIPKLKECWQLEQAILEKIGYMSTFHQLFVDLLKGEQVIQKLSEEESQLVSTIRTQMHEDKSIIKEWTHKTLEAIKVKVLELIKIDELDQHHDVDFEFVNRPEFIDLARSLKPDQVSESEFHVFVHVFREAFNSLYEHQ